MFGNPGTQINFFQILNMGFKLNCEIFVISVFYYLLYEICYFIFCSISFIYLFFKSTIGSIVGITDPMVDLKKQGGWEIYYTIWNNISLIIFKERKMCFFTFLIHMQDSHVNITNSMVNLQKDFHSIIFITALSLHIWR